MNIMRNKIVISLVYIISIGLIACGCSNTAQVKVEQIKNVKTVPAEVRNISVDVQYAALIKSQKDIKITSKLPGKITSIKVSVGKEVKEGDVLFEVEDKEIKAQYNQAQAALNAAESNYKKTSDSSMEQLIAQATSAVEQAQIGYNSAKEYYDKAKTMYQNKAITDVQLNEAKAKFELAESQLNSAQKNLDILKQKSVPQTVDAAASQVEQAKAAVETAKINLENTVVKSPVSGIVSAKNAEAGEMVSPGMPVLTIMSPNSLVAEVNVPYNILKNISLGQKTKLLIDGFNGEEIEGVIDTISPSADERTKEYNIKILLNNKKNNIKPGMFAEAIFTAEKKENVISVPVDAVINEKGYSFIYVLNENNKVTKKVVTTGITDYKYIEITSDLNANEPVIVEGQSFLNEGDTVNVVS